jgi:hypothetical protein
VKVGKMAQAVQLLDRRLLLRRVTGSNENLGMELRGLTSARVVRAFLEIWRREKPDVC